MPSDTTFGRLYNNLLLYSPATPTTLLKQFVNNSYSRALEAFDWSELRGSGFYQLPAPYATGTINLTNGSATVTGSGTAWTSVDHANKQLVVGGFAPFYDVASVESATSLTLSTAYVGPTVSAQAYTIQDIYLLAPSDLSHFTAFIDVQLDWWNLDRSMTQEVVDRYDPRRSLVASRPTQLFNATPSPFTATLGRPRYELWPRPPAGQTETYYFRYDRYLPLLTNDNDTLIYPLRGDVIREGAMEDLCLYPGTDEAPNPYHTGDFVARATYHNKRFMDGVAMAHRTDREIRSTLVQYKEDYKKLFPTGTLLSPSTVTMFTGIN